MPKLVIKNNMLPLYNMIQIILEIAVDFKFSDENSGHLFFLIYIFSSNNSSLD